MKDWMNAYGTPIKSISAMTSLSGSIQQTKDGSICPFLLQGDRLPRLLVPTTQVLFCGLDQPLCSLFHVLDINIMPQGS